MFPTSGMGYEEWMGRIIFADNLPSAIKVISIKIQPVTSTANIISPNHN
jgi:hypothetical protein